ncbi:metallophosphoesterase family protein [Paenibacillus turpanensis]|uniref:metallophosphoesterase family protein n=1 Tax=Paenibacillus turpanensis TaxID=2689078 RepID=UPI00140BBA14|nr:metallophosphoesterase family protein [Paenibacillus turpanensis]
MKIGIVADTHMPARAKRPPSALMKGLEGVDRILHAGDWTELEVLYWLEELAPVDGVAGNNDGDDIERQFGRQKIIEAGGYRFGLVHGDGYRSTPENAWAAFFAAKPEIIIFGHSHVPYKEQRGETLLFNPGSPTDKRRQPQFSYGIIELGEQGIDAKHYYYDSKE